MDHEVRSEQPMLCLVAAKPEQAAKKVRQRRSLPSPKRFAQAGRIDQRLNVRNEVRFASSLAAALLEGLFEQPVIQDLGSGLTIDLYLRVEKPARLWQRMAGIGSSSLSGPSG